MKYKVGDKVRVSKCSVEILKGQIDVIEEVYPHDNSYKLSRFDIRIAESNLRPTEFKIWCNTEEEKQAVIEELEKEGYVWKSGREKPTETTYIGFFGKKPCGLYIQNDELGWDNSKQNFHSDNTVEITPSEFTGIDFSHKSKKIIIEQTKTGAKATYGDKWSYVNGEFDDASRQALAEVLCPFKVGDMVKSKMLKIYGKIEKVQIDGKITVGFSNDSSMNCFDYELESYTEPLYNAKLFCIKGHGLFKQGVVYTVENGVFIGVHDSHYKDLEDINKKLCSQFMEIKGGLDD